MKYPNIEDDELLFNKLHNQNDEDEQYYPCGTMLISKVCTGTQPCNHKLINGDTVQTITSHAIVSLFIAQQLKVPEHFCNINPIKNKNIDINTTMNDNLSPSLQKLQNLKYTPRTEEDNMTDRIIYDDVLYNPADSFQNMDNLVERFRLMRDELNKLNGLIETEQRKLDKMVHSRNILTNAITPVTNERTIEVDRSYNLLEAVPLIFISMIMFALLMKLIM